MRAPKIEENLKRKRSKRRRVKPYSFREGRSSTESIANYLGGFKYTVDESREEGERKKMPGENKKEVEGEAETNGRKAEEGRPTEEKEEEERPKFMRS